MPNMPRISWGVNWVTDMLLEECGILMDSCFAVITRLVGLLIAIIIAKYLFIWIGHVLIVLQLCMQCDSED